MKLRDLGIEWVHPKAPLKLWMHPGKRFHKFETVLNEMDALMPVGDVSNKTGNYKRENIRAAFIYTEAFVLDYEYTGADSFPFLEYLKNRTLFNLAENLQLFMHILSYDDVEFIFDAHKATRPAGSDVPVEDTPEKKGNSGNDSSVNGKTNKTAKPAPQPA